MPRSPKKPPLVPGSLLPKNLNPQSPRGSGLWFLVGLAFVVSVFLWFFQSEQVTQLTTTETVKEVSLSEFLEQQQNGDFEKIIAKDWELTGFSAENSRTITTRDPQSSLFDLGILPATDDLKVEVKDTTRSHWWSSFLAGMLPILLIIGLIIFFSRRAMGKGGDYGPFSFGKSRAQVYEKGAKHTKFADVAGVDEAKQEVKEVVDFLRHPKKYRKAGAKIPKGILLVGSPGTGKTMLARAIAGEAEVPFYSISGSEFVEMFVGVGASRVRDLFKNAKKNAPAIIFIDEIDAIGKQRGQGMGGGHDEREQTLNQILTEMDGFAAGESVIVVAATNRPDVLDKALLRPGRFDRRVMVDLPDLDARLKILQVHAKNKTLAPKANLKKMAAKTVGFSGAELENLLNEAAIMSVKARKKGISQLHLEEAMEKVSIGPERRSRKFSAEERKMTAYHEVGHALAGHFCKTHDPVHKISIVSRGRALGLTWFLPETDIYTKTKQRLQDEMVSLHGGRVAERLVFGKENMTTGASNDLERISQIARAMIKRFGMGPQSIGPVVYEDHEIKNIECSPATAQAIDESIRQLILAAEKECESILSTHLELLHRISEDLIKNENIYREEFEAYFGKPKPKKSAKKVTKEKTAKK